MKLMDLDINKLSGLKKHFTANFESTGIAYVSNESADYQFVMRKNSKGGTVMFQYSNDVYKFYKTFDGFCKAALYRIKRGWKIKNNHKQ